MERKYRTSNRRKTEQAGDGRRGSLSRGRQDQVYTTSHESAVLGNTASACAFGPKKGYDKYSNSPHASKQAIVTRGRNMINDNSWWLMTVVVSQRICRESEGSNRKLQSNLAIHVSAFVHRIPKLQCHRPAFACLGSLFLEEGEMSILFINSNTVTMVSESSCPGR